MFCLVNQWCFTHTNTIILHVVLVFPLALQMSFQHILNPSGAITVGKKVKSLSEVEGLV